MTKEEYLFEPSEQEKIVRYIRKFCEPETCAAITFGNLVNNFQNRDIDESALKTLWKGGLVEPTKYESDPEDGALIEVRDGGHLHIFIFLGLLPIEWVHFDT